MESTTRPWGFVTLCLNQLLVWVPLYICLFTEISRKLVNKILYADKKILLATSEDDLQTMAHHLKLTARKYKWPYLVQ